MLCAVAFLTTIVATKAQSRSDFEKQYKSDIQNLADDYQRGIEALRADYRKSVDEYKAVIRQMLDSDEESLKLMSSDDGLVSAAPDKEPAATVSSAKIKTDIRNQKNELKKTTASTMLQQLSGDSQITDKTASGEVLDKATKQLYNIVKAVADSTTAPEKNSVPKQVPVDGYSGATTVLVVGQNNIPEGKPCNYLRISSPFGNRVHPIYKRTQFHKGIDLAAPNGTPVYATADGVVTYSGVCGGYGNFVKINHQNGYKTAYAHLSTIKVGKNANVRKGDLIGYVGSTGTSTGNHLHYEVHYNDKLIDPATTLGSK